MRTRTKHAGATPVFPPGPAAREPAPIERAALDFGKRWAPASEVLERVRAVRTRFLGFNRAVRVGGLPLDRVTVVSGSTHGGKTLFLLGLIHSFLEAGHVGALIDAEGTTPEEFAAELMGDVRRFPRFIAPPGVLTFETAIDAVSDLIDGLARHRAGAFPDLCGIAVVDSVTKLAPKGEIDKVKKKHAEELTKGHHGRARAAVIQAWLDNLTPRLKGSNLAVVLVAQERDIGDDDAGRPTGVADGTDWLEAGVKMKGGKALEFDSSVLARITKAEPVYLVPDDRKSPVVGWRHRVRIRKSKVAHMDGYFSESFFHVSNGAGDTPAGFDVSRDALDVGVDVGAVRLDGAWYKWAPRSGGPMRKWQGERAALAYLSKHPEQRDALVAEVADAIDAERGRVLSSGIVVKPCES